MMMTTRTALGLAIIADKFRDIASVRLSVKEFHSNNGAAWLDVRLVSGVVCVSAFIVDHDGCVFPSTGDRLKSSEEPLWAPS